MDIKRNGSQPSGKGPSDWFTGTVRVDPLFEAPVPARALGASVTFEPGARTAWHTHPLGQTLIVTSGCGRMQRWGGPIEEIRPGDVVWFAPGEKHWHGAAPLTAMTHIAIVEVLDGKTADWMEKSPPNNTKPDQNRNETTSLSYADWRHSRHAGDARLFRGKQNLPAGRGDSRPAVRRGRQKVLTGEVKFRYVLDIEHVK